MTRAELMAMKLEALRMLAAERGLDGARTLGRAELVERLAPEEPDAAAEISEPDATETDAPASAATETTPPTADEEKPESGGRRRRGPERGGFDVPSSTLHPHADELETLTMARRYAAEGQLDRALEIYEKLARIDADDETVRAAIADLHARRTERTDRPPPAPSGPSEPIGMLDLEEPPETYGIDECEVLYKNPFSIFVYWEVTDDGLAAARAQLGPSGGAARLILRIFNTAAAADRRVQDVDLSWNHGRRHLPAPQPGAQLRVAVGLLTPEGYFAPIANSTLLRVPPAEPAGEGPVEWMEVVPGRSRGRERESIVIVRRDQDHAERGVHHPGGAAGSAERSGADTSRGRWNPGSGSGSPTGAR